MELIERLKREARTRKIYIWGAWETGEKYIKLFQREGIQIDGVIDSKKIGAFCNIKIVKPEEIDGKKNEIFVFVSLVGHKEVNDILQKYGFFVGDDYLYEGNGITIQSLRNELYLDLYGNEIKGSFDDCMVYLRACGKLKIGKNVRIGKNVKIIVRDFSELVIGDNVILCGDLVIRVSDGSRVEIGDNTTIGINNVIYVLNNTKFQCGKDCMLSYNIMLRGNNAHTIFNSNGKKHTKENVILGNHVWVGMGSTLMPGTEIGDCSIVGASTLVNKKIPPHSLVVGTPCRILEEGVDWSRRDDVTEEEFMEEVKRRGF